MLPLFKQQFSVFKQYYMYFHTFFHPHVFPKNTNNVTRTTLPNEPYMFWNMFCDFFYYNVLRFRSLHSCSFLFLDQKMFNILRFKVLNYNSSKKKVVNYKCEFLFYFILFFSFYAKGPYTYIFWGHR